MSSAGLQADQRSGTGSQLAADDVSSQQLSQVTMPPSPASDQLLQTKYRSQLHVQVHVTSPLHFIIHFNYSRNYYYLYLYLLLQPLC